MAKKSKGNREIYEFYQQRCREKKVPFLPYMTCITLWNDANLQMKNLILMEGEIIKLPFQLGTLSIIKVKLNYKNRPLNKLKINWPESKRLKTTVYFTPEYYYRVRWTKGKTNKHNLFHFKPANRFKTQIAHCVNTLGLDYLPPQ